MRASSNDHPVPADELDPLSDYLKGKILFAKIKSKTISTTTSTSHIVDDTFSDTLGVKTILAGIGSFVTAATSYIFVCLYKFLRNERHFKVCNFNNSYTVNSCSTYMFLEKLVYTKNPSIPPTPPARTCAETIVELIAMGPSSSNNELVNFISNICLLCYSLIVPVLSETIPILNGT
ncbi:unnamed protein product, partial [Rotaria socialis]